MKREFLISMAWANSFGQFGFSSRTATTGGALVPLSALNECRRLTAADNGTAQDRVVVLAVSEIEPIDA